MTKKRYWIEPGPCDELFVWTEGKDAWHPKEVAYWCEDGSWWVYDGRLTADDFISIGETIRKYEAAHGEYLSEYERGRKDALEELP